MIRAMRATDALAVWALTADGAANELTALTWPKTPPESKRLSLLALLPATLLPPGRRTRVAIACEGPRVRGILTARARALGHVWDVEHLLSAGATDSCVELLRWLGHEAARAGARRLFLDTAAEGVGVEVASRAGFEQCTRGSIYRREPGLDIAPRDTFPARPRLRSDEMTLFQLYNAAVPANVRAAEALTYEEWAALHRGGKLWAPTVLGDGQEYVWEMGSRAVGWMRIIFGERAQYLSVIVHPQSEAFAERMLREALGQLSTKAPILADVREYQGAIEAAVQAASFDREHDYVVWVRQLAERVAESTPAAAVRAQTSPSV